jgi:hypothetical protein
MCRIGFFLFSITNLNWCSIIHWPCKHQNNWSQSLEGGVVKKCTFFVIIAMNTIAFIVKINIHIMQNILKTTTIAYFMFDLSSLNKRHNILNDCQLVILNSNFNFLIDMFTNVDMLYFYHFLLLCQL